MSQYYERPIAFRVRNVFSNHMVLQRGKNIRVFGECEDNTEVTVKLVLPDGCEVVAEAIVKDNEWCAILPAQKACVGCEVEVEAINTITKDTIATVKYEDVAIGEVWLAGGQSNMEFELKDCKGGMETLENDKDTNVRFYYTPKNPYKTKEFYEAEEGTCWQIFSKDNARNWSAVGYYFARKLSKDLGGVTVGVIGCNWGGTSASTWMSTQALREDVDLATYVEEYDVACEGKTLEEQEKAYDDYVKYHAEWEPKCGKLYEERPDITWGEVQEILGPCQYPGPMNAKNPYRPAGLWECMLTRVAPYTLGGVIYYQGESDDHKPQMYQKLLTRLISEWRELFKDLELPFLMTQLTMHKYQYDEDFMNWPIIREAQMNVHRTIKNTGIAVIIDKGEFNNIHPLDKLPVGERLELQALTYVYGLMDREEAYGPVYKACVCHGDSIEVLFDYANDGFVVKDKEGNVLSDKDTVGFEVAGQDKNFVKADVKIKGSKIIVSSDEVERPLYVRYLWTNFGEVNLFGKNNIPVAPFRNEKW